MLQNIIFILVLSLSSISANSVDTYNVEKFNIFCVSYEESTCVEHPGVYHTVVNSNGERTLRVLFLTGKGEPKKHLL